VAQTEVTAAELMNFPGHTELLAARTLLAADVADRSTILAAAECVWGAMFHRDEWPPELQVEADTLQPMLFRYGTIRMTVDSMNDAELAELQAALKAFIEAAENAAA
jgi:hypothetical protein